MNPSLLALSEIVTPQGRTIQKLDLIATVSIDGTPYLTVYRRYNSVHEIIVVDCQDDIYLQRDLPLLESIRHVLCLSQEQTARVRITDLFSFLHQGPPPTGHPSPLSLHWSDIQSLWQGIAVDLTDVWTPSASSVTASSSDQNLIQLLANLPPSAVKKRSWSQREDGQQTDTGRTKREK